MDHICVQWIHNSADNPVLLYSELDAERWEVRKVEVYADGSVGYASPTVEAGGSLLGTVPVPTLDEITQQHEFKPKTISRAEFERVWADAINGVSRLHQK